MDALKDEERQTSWQVAGLKLTCDQLRQKCSDEMKESEWQFKQEAEELVRRRTALDKLYIVTNSVFIKVHSGARREVIWLSIAWTRVWSQTILR